MNILKHYKMLIWFLHNRYKSNNYEKMRRYFADILIRDIEEHVSLSEANIVDVGGADGVFCRTLEEERSCTAISLDPNVVNSEYKKSIVAYANSIPAKDGSFDVVVCRGVLEHIHPGEQQNSLDEMYRVMKPGGYGYFVIPPWFNPHAGHELKPFHVLPFRIAKVLREKVYGERIIAKSYDDISLYKITFRKMKIMIYNSGYIIVKTLDTHFRLHINTKIALVREVAVPAVTYIVRKPD